MLYSRALSEESSNNTIMNMFVCDSWLTGQKDSGNAVTQPFLHISDSPSHADTVCHAGVCGNATSFLLLITYLNCSSILQHHFGYPNTALSCSINGTSKKQILSHSQFYKHRAPFGVSNAQSKSEELRFGKNFYHYLSTVCRDFSETRGRVRCALALAISEAVAATLNSMKALQWNSVDGRSNSQTELKGVQHKVNLVNVKELCIASLSVSSLQLESTQIEPLNIFASHCWRYLYTIIISITKARMFQMYSRKGIYLVYLSHFWPFVLYILIKVECSHSLFA